MFTGIIQDIGTVMDIRKTGDWRIVIETRMDLGGTPIGASIACAGCCLTVVEKTTNSFSVDVSAESLSKTNIGTWNVGRRINIEPSLKLGDELGGHFVFGHVDGLATIKNIRKEGDSHRLEMETPQSLSRYIAAKGSVSMDGVSLTVNEIQNNIFGVNIIPHTWSHTTLGAMKVNDQVNLEIDMLARYVARMLGKDDLRSAA